MKLYKKVILASIFILLLFCIFYFIVILHFKDYKMLNILNNKSINNDNLKIVSENEYIKDIVGYLTIEKANLKDEVIKEGTKDNILKNNIGHFSNTSRYNGNVCLAAHNYSVNNSCLFSNLDKLEIGDEIIYKTEYETSKYKVNSINEIKSNDFKVLENTNENILTLITCIGLRKDVRLCVKAIKIKEE